MTAVAPTNVAPSGHRPTRKQQAQGLAAEKKCQRWLDWCHLPYMYVEQSTFTVPEYLRGQIKRPDWLVGIPTIGIVALDVKAKTTYQDHILIDASEHAKFRNFENYFNTTVWYLCFPPDQEHRCHLFKNRDLDLLRPLQSRSRLTYWMPLQRTHLADDRREFTATLLNAISLRRP